MIGQKFWAEGLGRNYGQKDWAEIMGRRIGQKLMHGNFCP
jgi:hypothetical protein